ncbi:MAG: hypothetical protein ABJN35_08465 [Erythrobacter sp.]
MTEGDDSRYLTDEQLEARLPWRKRLSKGFLGGCLTVDLAVVAMVGIPLWWML